MKRKIFLMHRWKTGIWFCLFLLQGVVDFNAVGGYTKLSINLLKNKGITTKWLYLSSNSKNLDKQLSVQYSDKEIIREVVGITCPLEFSLRRKEDGKEKEFTLTVNNKLLFFWIRVFHLRKLMFTLRSFLILSLNVIKQIRNKLNRVYRILRKVHLNKILK